jgi:hypothetical protein
VVYFFLTFQATFSMLSSSSPCMLHTMTVSLQLFQFYLAVQIMKLVVMHLSPTSYHFARLLSKYSPQRPVLKHPQSIFQRSNLTPLKQNHITFINFIFVGCILLRYLHILYCSRMRIIETTRIEYHYDSYHLKMARRGRNME